MTGLKRFKQDINIVYDGKASERAADWVEGRLRWGERIGWLVIFLEE